MKWLPLDEQIIYNTDIRTYKALNEKIDHELSHQLILNTHKNRIGTQKKLAAKPRSIIKSKLSRSSLRSRCYHYNMLPKVITTAKTFDSFKSMLYEYMYQQKRK